MVCLVGTLCPSRPCTQVLPAVDLQLRCNTAGLWDLNKDCSLAGRSPSGGGWDGVAMLCAGCVLPLPIGDWVQGCVSPRLQSGSACLTEHLGQQGGGSGLAAPGRQGASVHACRRCIQYGGSSYASQSHKAQYTWYHHDMTSVRCMMIITTCMSTL